MATQTTTLSETTATEKRNPREQLLRWVLIGNIAFSTMSAGLFLLASQGIADFIGISDAMVFDLINGVNFISFLGVGLAGFALYLLYTVTRNPINIRLAWSIVTADVVWVVLSWLLLATGAIPFSTAGNWAVLIIADIVLVFAIAEVVGIRRINR